MKNGYIKLFLRLLGLAGGFYGIFFVGSALICLKETILNPAQGGSYVLYIIRLLVGIYLIYVAYLALFRFSKNAIRNLSFIIAFFIGIRLPSDIIMENPNVYSLGHLLFQILCIVLAVLFYIFGSQLFIKWCLNKGEN